MVAIDFTASNGDPVRCAPPPPPSGTKWTRRVPHPVLIGHVASRSKRFDTP